MKEYQLKTKMKSYQWDELTDEQREVLELAKAQTKHSYCPYSGFHVGAAAKLGNGVLIPGCNQENAAFPAMRPPSHRRAALSIRINLLYVWLLRAIPMAISPRNPVLLAAHAVK